MNAKSATEMESNSDKNWNKSLVQTLSEFAFLLTIIIGLSSSMELTRRLLTKRSFRKKFALRYLLLLKVVSDVVMLVSSVASFSLQAFLNRWPMLHPASFYAWFEVYSRVLVIASAVSELTTFLYSYISLMNLARQRRENKTAAYFVSASTLVVVIAMESRILVVPLRIIYSSSAHYLVSALTTFVFWADVLTLILLCIICGSVAIEEFSKVCVPFDDETCLATKNKEHDNIIAGKNKSHHINIKIGAEDTTKKKNCNTNIADDSNIEVNSVGMICYEKDEPCSAKTKLLLFLLGIVLSCFLFNCILMYRNISGFSGNLEIIYAFYSTATIIAVLLREQKF